MRRYALAAVVLVLLTACGPSEPDRSAVERDLERAGIDVSSKPDGWWTEYREYILNLCDGSEQVNKDTARITRLNYPDTAEQMVRGMRIGTSYYCPDRAQYFN